MSYTWSPPNIGQFKVNVHYLHSSRQQNGNFNGIGVTVRDHRGRPVTALTGTIRGLLPLATSLWALHLGLNSARKAHCELITLETDNYTPYYEIVRKDGRGDRTCLWVVEQIKKLLGYNPKWVNGIHLVEATANRSAHYLATVGISHWDTMYEVREPFGRLQEKLDLDMGFGPPIPQLLVSPIPRDSLGFVRGFAPLGTVPPREVEPDIPDYNSDNGGLLVVV